MDQNYISLTTCNVHSPGIPNFMSICLLVSGMKHADGHEFHCVF